MKNIDVEVQPIQVVKLVYDNDFTTRMSGVPALKLQSQASIKLSNENPVVAVVVINTQAIDEENKFKFEIETVTGLIASQYIDNYDAVIREKYMPLIAMSSNEQIRSVVNLLGVPIQIPNPHLNVVVE